jgi:multidrug efflux pump subunit AcrA (membrane-fusion protein)
MPTYTLSVEMDTMNKIQKMVLFRFIGIVIFLLPFFSSLWAQDKPKGSPPAKVVVAAVSTGEVAPQSEFIGTIFYQEMSDVASEVSGLVEEVRFEEGQLKKEFEPWWQPTNRFWPSFKKRG